MSELDRRAQKKAETREQIRKIAHRLFDMRGFDVVTIADIARQADVAVQTVFNHFATKEELFFDGRGPQIDAPALAVRSRDVSVSPLSALRAFLVDLAGSHLASLADEDRRRYLITLLGSESLRAYERELLIEAERRLAVALSDAWHDSDPSAVPVPSDPTTAAAVIAAMWCSAARVLTHSNRQRLISGADAEKVAAAVEALAADLFAQFEISALLAAGGSAPEIAVPADLVRTGWPLTVQRAG